MNDDFSAFEPIRARVDALIDPTGVFRERRSS